MENTIVFGHKSPDTDTICSAIVKSILEKKKNGIEITPVRLGNINKETQFVLDYLKIDAPILIEKVEEGQPVILVDHNEFSQSADGIENAKILGVIDHHRVYGFQTAEPLYYTARPYGCTCTILYNMFNDSNIEIEKLEATLMASAIISDTLLLKSPTTTQKDIDALEDLSKIANIDVNTYGLDMLKAGTDLSDYSAEELINIDAKLVDMNGNKVKIAQVNTADINDVLKNQDELEKAITNDIQNNNLNLFMLAITDIINSNSEIIALGNRCDIVEKSYNVKLENNRAFLPGVVSRKKQMVPIMQENA